MPCFSFLFTALLLHIVHVMSVFSFSIKTSKLEIFSLRHRYIITEPTVATVRRGGRYETDMTRALIYIDWGFR